MGVRASEAERLLSELVARNADNVTRTESYLELYAYTRAHPPDLPWVLMAHLVSRNGGYMMTDVAQALARRDSLFSRRALESLFLFLERANTLIFYDAWHHVLMHLAGRSTELSPPRTTRFICKAWLRHEEAMRAEGLTPALERRLVQELVTNEQNFIERRVVHNPRFEPARAIVGFIEEIGRDAPLVMPCFEGSLRVGRFARLDRRIAMGWRIFDEVMADPGRREAVYEWARQHPHTGSRSVYGGRAGPTVREAWPIQAVRTLWSEVHAPPEEDPFW